LYFHDLTLILSGKIWWIRNMNSFSSICHKCTTLTRNKCFT
jgi:hypothetical protein